MRRPLLVLGGIGVIACGVYLALIPGGCAVLSPIPYCNEYVAQLQELETALWKFFGPRVLAIVGFVRGHLSLFAGGYALLALYAFTGREHGYVLELFKPFIIAGAVLGVLCFGGLWVATACGCIHNPAGGDGLLVDGIGFLRTMAGLCKALLTLALGLTFWVVVPFYLVLLIIFILLFAPGIVWTLLYLTVRAPVIIWHYIHYLFVPHPAETAYKEGMAKDLPSPEIAAKVADAMYQYDFKDYSGLPPAWVSKNQIRRIEGFQKLVEAGDVFMDAVIKNLETKERLETAELLEGLWQKHLKKMRESQSKAKS